MAGRLAWGLSGSVVLLVAATLVVAFALTRPPVVSVADAAWLVALGSYAIAGAFIASRHLRNGVGWLLISVGVLVGIAGLADAYAGYAVASGAAGGTLARWLQSLLWDPASPCCSSASPCSSRRDGCRVADGGPWRRSPPWPRSH